MIGGLVSKKRGKVDIRHQEGKNEEELTLELSLGFTGVTEWERIGRTLKERWLHPWRNTEDGVAKTRGCIGISSRDKSTIYLQCCMQYPIFTWGNMV